MRSTYSRLNASCISQSQYDSNRYVTGGYQPNDVTAISPMPMEQYHSQVNIPQMSTRFDRSDLYKERSSQYDAFINYSQIDQSQYATNPCVNNTQIIPNAAQNMNDS